MVYHFDKTDFHRDVIKYAQIACAHDFMTTKTCDVTEAIQLNFPAININNKKKQGPLLLCFKTNHIYCSIDKIGAKQIST